MKLFGGKKPRQRSQPENFKAVSDETRVIPKLENRIKASFVRMKMDKKRAAAISIYSAAALLFVVLLASVGSRIVDNAPDKSEEPVFKEENFSDKDSNTENRGTANVVLPLIPSDPEDTGMMAIPHGEMDGEQLKKENYRNFLFCVYDNSGIYVDTIIVGRLDRVEGKLDIVNIPRDALINVSWDLKKISTVMQKENGDYQRFLNELSGILGFTIDYYAFVEAETVGKLVDAVGGLYYTIQRNMVSQAENINITSGLQWVNGAKAQQMLKFRSGYSDGELGRIEIVQDFLMEILSMYISGSEGKNLDKVIDTFSEYSEGNIDEEVLRNFAVILNEIDGINIRFATMPGKNVPIRNTTYYEISAVEWAEIINEHLNPYEQEIVLHNLDILMFDASSMTVMSTCGEMIDYDSFY
ncbi:MAG: LytR family transcriptional regulator [Ruminococcaceae bacterium]|nr:LytR family transcriptional regulator [Oscillospiraceae bacterium]